MVSKSKIILNLEEIHFDDGVGGKECIGAPSLILMFQSDNLRRAYEKDPHQEYSIYDLMKIMEGDITLKEVTIASNFERHKNIFHKCGMRIESRNKRLSRVVVVRLKPVTKYIFEAVKKIRLDLEDKRK